MRWPQPRPRSPRRHPEPLGVVLAGGRGRRLGGTKATAELHGRPLISYPLEAMGAALGEVVVLAKPDTPLPSLPGMTVWIEPGPRHHPLVGIVQALGLAGDRAVLVCGVDLPLLTPALIRRLSVHDARGAPAVLAAAGGVIQPLLARYEPQALRVLPADPGERPLRELVRALAPALLEVDDPEELFNVNAPEDLLRAAAILDRRRAEGGRPTQT